MALRRRLRCPSEIPSFSRSPSVSSGRRSASMSLARKSASYCPSPRLLSQPPTSMAALHGPERIILRLKHAVQGRAVEGPTVDRLATLINNHLDRENRPWSLVVDPGVVPHL